MIRLARIDLSSEEAKFLLLTLREHIDAKHAEILLKAESQQHRALIDKLTLIANLNVKLTNVVRDVFPHLTG